MTPSPEYEQHLKNIELANLLVRAMAVLPHTPLNRILDQVMNWCDKPQSHQQVITMPNHMLKDKLEKWLKIHENHRPSG